jgi:hypothetical protein
MAKRCISLLISLRLVFECYLNSNGAVSVMQTPCKTSRETTEERLRRVEIEQQGGPFTGCSERELGNFAHLLDRDKVETQLVSGDRQTAQLTRGLTQSEELYRNTALKAAKR